MKEPLTNGARRRGFLRRTKPSSGMLRVLRKHAQPWRMCRTCHRQGTTKLSCGQYHALGTKGACGQCGAYRPLIECHSYDFRPRRAPIKRTRIKPNRKKTEKRLERTHGPKAFRDFVRSLPCAACGAVGYSDNAHLLGNDGLSRKKPWTTVGPLCRTHPQWIDDGKTLAVVMGCHTLFDDKSSAFDVLHPQFHPAAVAAQTQRDFAAYLESEHA